MFYIVTTHWCITVSGAAVVVYLPGAFYINRKSDASPHEQQMK